MNEIIGMRQFLVRLSLEDDGIALGKDVFSCCWIALQRKGLWHLRYRQAKFIVDQTKSLSVQSR